MTIISLKKTSIEYGQINFAAVILSGGSASRMSGRAKGNLKINRCDTILSHLIKQIKKSSINQIIISANDETLYDDYEIPIVPDQYLNIGPLAGVESALEYFKDKVDALFILPCDLPNVDANDIELLKNAFKSNSGISLYAQSSDGKDQPLFAIINIKQKKLIRDAIDLGSRKVIDVWKAIGVIPIIFKNKSFLNINSLEDLKKLEFFS